MHCTPTRLTTDQSISLPLRSFNTHFTYEQHLQNPQRQISAASWESTNDHETGLGLSIKRSQLEAITKTTKRSEEEEEEEEEGEEYKRRTKRRGKEKGHETKTRFRGWDRIS